MYTYEGLKITLKEAYKTTDYKEFQKLKKELIKLLNEMGKEKRDATELKVKNTGGNFDT